MVLGWLVWAFESLSFVPLGRFLWSHLFLRCHKNNLTKALIILWLDMAVDCMAFVGGRHVADSGLWAIAGADRYKILCPGTE